MLRSPTGVVTTACLEEETKRNTGNPGGVVRVTGNEDSARSRLGRAGWRRGP
jgi:hypothetical protein